MFLEHPPGGSHDRSTNYDTSPKKPFNFNYYHTGQRRSVPAEHKEMTTAGEIDLPMESMVAFAEIALEKQLTGMNIPAADDITLDEVVEKSDGVMRIVDPPSL